MTELHRSLVTNLKVLRRRWGYSQAELAERAGLSVGYIGELETGGKWPAAEKIESLAAALQVKAYQLFLDPADAQLFQDWLERRDTVAELGRDLWAYFEKQAR
jgi:transcriptional regulator with XRE-family HTH domain